MSADTDPEKTIPDEVEAESDKTAAERVIFFSDAVVAIAITLLALELPTPTGHTTAAAWASFRGNFDDYLAFLISFVVIANQWFGHHWLYRYVRRVNRAVTRVNMIWLLTVTLVPFVTRVLVSDTAFPMAFTLYAALQAVSQLTFLAIILMLRHDHLTESDVPPQIFNGAIARAVAFASGFLISIPLGYVTHWAYLLWALPPYLPRIFRLVTRRREPAHVASHQSH